MLTRTSAVAAVDHALQAADQVMSATARPRSQAGTGRPPEAHTHRCRMHREGLREGAHRAARHSQSPRAPTGPAARETPHSSA